MAAADFLRGYMKTQKTKKTLIATLAIVTIIFTISFGYTNVYAVPGVDAYSHYENAGEAWENGEYFEAFKEGAIGTAENLLPGELMETIGQSALNKGLSKLGGVAADIMDEAFEGLSKNVMEPTNAVSDKLTFSELLNKLGPTPALFQQLIGLNVFNQITNFVAIIGAAISIILFVIYLMTYMMSPDKVKTSPLKMIVRLIIVAAFITTASSTTMWIENYVFSPIYSKMTVGVAETKLSVYSMYEHPEKTVNENSEEKETDGKLFGQSYDVFKKSPFRYIPAIISFIMIIPILKELIRLVIECVERYIVLHILYTLSPIAAATFTVESTENVGKSYIQMVLAQFFLTCMSKTYILVSIIVITKTYIPIFTKTTQNTQGSGGIVTALINLIMCLAVMKAFQRIDNYLRAMGIGVAQTSGQLADSLQSSLRNLGRSVGGALRGANNGRKAVGSGLQTIGANTGNRTAFNVGAVMGASLAGGGIPTKSALDKKWAEGRGSLGKTANLDGESSKNLLAGYLQNYRGNQGAAGALDRKSMINGAKELTGLDVKSASIDNHGGIKITWDDENGYEHSGRISMEESKSSEALYDGDGNVVGFLDTYPNKEAEAMAQQGYEAVVDGNTAEQLFENNGSAGMAYNSDVFKPIENVMDKTTIGSESTETGEHDNTTSVVGYVTRGESGECLGIEGKPIASLSDDINRSSRVGNWETYGNNATGENVMSINTDKNGNKTAYFNAGFTQYDPDQGAHVMPPEKAENVAQLYEANFPGSKVMRDSDGKPQVTYDSKLKQTEIMTKEEGSEKVSKTIMRDNVQPGQAVVQDGEQITGRKTVMISKDPEHMTGVRFYKTKKKIKTSKK